MARNFFLRVPVFAMTSYPAPLIPRPIRTAVLFVLPLWALCLVTAPFVDNVDPIWLICLELPYCLALVVLVVGLVLADRWRLRYWWCWSLIIPLAAMGSFWAFLWLFPPEKWLDKLSFLPLIQVTLFSWLGFSLVVAAVGWVDYFRRPR